MNISNGIFEHYGKIKESIWLFLWCIDRQTKTSGEVLGGKAITYELVKLDIPSLSLRTYRRWIKKLQEKGYILVRRTPAGLSITVTNQKKYSESDVPKMATQAQEGYAKNGTSDVTHMAHRYAKNGTSLLYDSNKTLNIPLTPKGELSLFLEAFNKEFGTRYQVTKGKKDKLEARLKSYSMAQILEALKNMAAKPFYKGDNDRGWVANPDFLLRNDEQIDKFLNMKPVEKSPFSPGYKLYDPNETYN